MSQPRERTVAYPHRVLKKVSIYLTNQVERDGKYVSTTDVGDNQTITVTSCIQLSPKDGRVFDYTLSRIQALGLDNTEVTFDTEELLLELGTSNRTENRKKVINSLMSMVDVKVKLVWDGGSITFDMLKSVEVLEGTSTVKVVLSDSFLLAMTVDSAKRRYINISNTMLAKSTYTIELAKLLQMYGKGVIKGKGNPIPVKEVSHPVICHYLGLDYEKNSSLTQVRKAFTELSRLGYTVYKFSTTRGLWKRVD